MFKKKKPLIILAIIGGIVIGLFIVGKLTGAFTYHTLRSGANSPTLQPGSIFFSSNLVSPKRQDLIVFNFQAPELGKQLWVFRLCGMPGDKIEIKNGTVYANGHDTDKPLNLKLMYLIPDTSIITVTEYFDLEDDDSPVQIDSGRAIAFLSKEQMKELTAIKIPCERYLHSKTQPPPPEIEAIYHQPWTIEDFGPVEVPKDHYFVLGDNRYMAQDSRYIGFIKKSDLYGVVLGVK